MTKKGKPPPIHVHDLFDLARIEWGNGRRFQTVIDSLARATIMILLRYGHCDADKAWTFNLRAAYRDAAAMGRTLRSTPRGHLYGALAIRQAISGARAAGKEYKKPRKETQ